LVITKVNEQGSGSARKENTNGVLAGPPTIILPGVRKIFRGPLQKNFSLKKVLLNLFKVF